MIAEFRLPDLGEGLPEAEIVQWLVAEGEEVELNQTIAEVETAKAVVEIPSPYAGRVQGLHAAAGDVVAVGAPLVSFTVGAVDDEPSAPAAAAGRAVEVTAQGGAQRLADGEGRTETPARAAETAAGTSAAPPGDDIAARATPNLVGYGAAPASGSRPKRRARGAGTAILDVDTAVREAAPHDVVRTGPIDLPLERPRSTPPVRKLAKDLGVDLVLVASAHPGETVTRAHVEEFAARTPVASGPAPVHQVSTVPPAAPQTGTAAPTAGDGSAAISAGRDTRGTADRVTRTPIRGVRKHTAAAMVQSAFTAPHATTFLTLDVTATTELLASLKTDRALDGHRIGVLAIVAKAVCLALGRTPAVNARWDEAAGEIVAHHYVNLGIAAATERGLVVPVIRDAERLPLVDLADAIAELAATARAGRTAPADMSGGTFSITNVGVFGVDAGTPILNPGEAGILAVGAVRRTPWEHHGEIALRDVLTLSLSFDHRLVDGAEAARFLTDVAGVLREPGRAMLLR